MHKIYNFDKDVKDDEANFKKELNYDPYLPRQFFRWAICGATGSGKTNFLLHTLIGDENTFKFDRIWLYVADPTEDKYEVLKERLDGVAQQAVSTMAKLGHRIPKPEILKVISDLENMPKLTKELKDEQLSKILIIDDWNGCKKTDMWLDSYIKKCRKFHVNIVYLAQNYYQIPTTIRQNMDYISIYEIPDKRQMINLAQTYSLGIDKDEFLKKYKLATSRPYMPLTIDVSPYTRINRPDYMFRSGLLPLTEMSKKDDEKPADK